MSLQTDLKLRLRISSSTTAFDDEVDDLIDAAIDDLKLAGVLTSVMDAFELDPGTDKLLKRAIMVYGKANFGFDNTDSERQMKSYLSLKLHITLSDEYITEVV